MKKLKPGHVAFDSDEVEWLIAHLLVACRTAKELGFECDHADPLHRIIDKVDRARFADGVPLLLPANKTMAKSIAAIKKLYKK